MLRGEKRASPAWAETPTNARAAAIPNGRIHSFLTTDLLRVVRKSVDLLKGSKIQSTCFEKWGAPLASKGAQGGEKRASKSQKTATRPDPMPRALAESKNA
jgi:hypothetical protein